MRPALVRFERAATDTVARADQAFPVGSVPTTTTELSALLGLISILHGEWVRIHPFANGNGRIARLWANWCAMRYELPPFVSTRPRPHHPGYALAARASMAGDHQPMTAALRDLLTTHR